jgi:transposase
LWVNLKSDRFGLPLVFKPDYRIRELRRLFAEYQILNGQITKFKTIIQANLSDVGIALLKESRKILFKPSGESYLQTLKISETLKITISMNLEMMWIAEKNKKLMAKEIVKAGEFLQDQVQLLISIKGISPFVALAFLSDVGDINRFSSQKKLNSYLGLVKNAHESGGKTMNGHITKFSRHLTRWILTQSIPHIVKSSSYMHLFYTNLKDRRGAGRSRIAVMRKTVGIMRRLLLNKEIYKYCDEPSYKRKIQKYGRVLNKFKLAS